MFPFLELPTDLRLVIYEHIFLADGPIDLYPLVLPHNVDTVRYAHKNLIHGRFNAVILRVCRQVHDEAAHVLYSGNAFHFSRFLAWGALVHWLTQIGDTNRRSLRSLALVSPTRDMTFREMMPEPWMFARSKPLKSFGRRTGVPVFERRPTLFSTSPLMEGVELLKECENLKDLSLLVHQFSHPWGKAMKDGDERIQWLLDKLSCLPSLKVRFILLDTVDLILESYRSGTDTMRFMVGFDARYVRNFDHQSVLQGLSPVKTEAHEALSVSKRLGCSIYFGKVDEYAFWSPTDTRDITQEVDSKTGCVGSAARLPIPTFPDTLEPVEALHGERQQELTSDQANMWARLDERVAQTAVTAATISALPCNYGYDLYWR